MVKPSCATKYCDNTCQIFGGPPCGRLFPSFGGWCSYLGRGVDSLLPCGRSCGRPTLCNNPEVCDEVCGCGCGCSGCGVTGSCGGHPGRGCGALPPPGFCRQKSAFRLWPQFQCCPELAGGLTGCNSGACGGCNTGYGGYWGRRGCGCATCDTSATSGNGHIVTYPPASEIHSAPDLPQSRMKQPTPAAPPRAMPNPAPQMQPMLEPEIPQPLPEAEPEMPLQPKKADPFGDDNLPPVDRDAFHMAPPARLPSRAAGSTKPAPALKKDRTAKLEPVTVDIAPAVHVDEAAVSHIKSRPITLEGPRLSAPQKPGVDLKPDLPKNPLRG